MCRRNHFWGFGLVAFGLGLLLGSWCEGGFLWYCLGLGMLFFGLSYWCKK